MAYIVIAIYVVLYICDFRVCLVSSDSRQNTMIWYEQANVNADCSVQGRNQKTYFGEA